MPAFSSVGWDCRCRNYITEKTVQEPDSENSKSTRWNNTINPCIFSLPQKSHTSAYFLYYPVKLFVFSCRLIAERCDAQWPSPASGTINKLLVMYIVCG
jgi:hypothetical protein